MLPVSHLQGAPLTLQGVGLAAALAGLCPVTLPRATDPEKEPAATSHLEKALWVCVRGAVGFLATGCRALGILRGLPALHGAEVAAFCPLLAAPAPGLSS